MENSTIIYYTSNKEKPEFEKKIMEELVKSSNLSIISVSQKPIELGKNICVGEVGASNTNLYRQILIGCEAAITPFVIMAEADCLYPPEYFTFIPNELDICYRYDNLYIINKWTSGYYKKSGSACAQIVGREYCIKKLKDALKNCPEWTKSILKKDSPLECFTKDIRRTYGFESPVINIKTGNGLRKKTQILKNLPPKETVPYWGLCEELRRRIL